MRDPLIIESIKNDSQLVHLESLGFKFGDKSAHTSRTIMLKELSILLRARPIESSRSAYVTAIIEENCLGKHTLSTRRLTLQRMSELYALDPLVSIFRLLRLFWDSEERAQAQIALLAALARDPLLRATASVVLAMQPSEEIARQRFTDAVRDAVGQRLNDDIIDKVVRNTASSWTQSGHLVGRSRKKRAEIDPSPASTAFALVLGYLIGTRGQNLFETLFTRVLDCGANELTLLAIDAKRRGFLDIKSGGGMTDISFDCILNEQEKRLSYGSH
jgi:hypothetical protein